jgi:hypothetical protein
MYCIFGLFDVLGFKGFCENCDFSNAERVLKMMDDFETEIPEILLHGLDAKNDMPQDKIDLLKNRLKWLTFSDTIFVAMPLDLSAHPDATKFNLIFFTILSAFINRRMFEIGLPVRGAIHIGDVMISKRCFAGKPIMDAHRLGEKCQLAATVVSDETYALVFKLFSEPKGYHFMFADAIIECDVPTGTMQLSATLLGNTSQKMKTLCWFFLEMGRMEPFIVPSDLNSFVQAKFRAHGKTLSRDKEILKAFNTEKLFQDWKVTSNRTFRQRQQVVITARNDATLSLRLAP